MGVANNLPMVCDSGFISVDQSAAFESYQSVRLQPTHVNAESSSNIRVNYGVPQGSVLGPSLFT